MGERPPGRIAPHPLVEVTRMCGLSGCGYPHVRLVMHVLNCSRHATARPKSSRHVDGLLDERLAHGGRAGEGAAVNSSAGSQCHIPPKDR
jgi:hypothetical protein